MAKDQQIGLLSDIVNQLRQLNRSSVRDKLQENEQTKRTAKLAEVVEDSTVENTGLISSAQDFQRRFMAGQARTEFNAAIKDKKSTLAGQELLLKSSDWQSDILRDISEHSSLGTEVGVSRLIMLEGIYDILENQYDMWKGLLAGQKTQLAFDQKIHKIDDRRYMNGLRNANEKRLEGITGGARGAALGLSGPGGNLIEGEIVPEEDKGMSTAAAVAAGGLGMWILGKIKAVGAWFGKGIKWGKGLLGRFAAIGLALFSKNPKQRRILGPAQKKMAKNPRMWPVLLATLVAANILDGFMTVDDELSGPESSGTADDSAGESTILSTIGDVAMTGLNVLNAAWLANHFTKGWLAKKTAAILATTWKGFKSVPGLARLGRSLLMVGTTLAAGATLPVLAVGIAAAVAAYYAGDIIEAVVKSMSESAGSSAIGTTNETAAGNKAETDNFLNQFKDVVPVNPDGMGGASLQMILDDTLSQAFKRLAANIPGILALMDILRGNGFNDGQIKYYMDLAGVSLKGTKGVSTKNQGLPWMKAGANSKATKEFYAGMKNSTQLMSLAEVALRIKKDKEKQAQFVEMNKTTADGPFPSFGKMPLDLITTKQYGLGSPEMNALANRVDPANNGTNVINTDASSNSSTVNIIYQDHVLKDYSGMNSYTSASGEKWSW